MNVTLDKPDKRRRTWRLRWQWKGQTCSLSGFRSKRASEILAHNVEELGAYRMAGGAPDAKLVQWIRDSLDDKRRKRLEVYGLIDEMIIAGTVTLDQHIAEYLEEISYGNTSKYLQLTKSRVEYMLAGTSVYAQIDSTRITRKLDQLRRQGRSQATQNHYLTAVKMFTRWMYETGRTSRDPIVGMKRVDVSVMVRPTRDLTIEEVQLIIEAAAKWEPTSPHSRHALSGAERAAIYQLAVETGLREKEIVKLSVGDYLPGSMELRVKSEHTKNSKVAFMPLLPDMCDQLNRICEGKYPEAPIFHSLRHSFITWVGQENDLKTTQEMARHADPQTTARYMHTTPERMRLAMNNHPNVKSVRRHRDRRVG